MPIRNPALQCAASRTRNIVEKSKKKSMISDRPVLLTGAHRSGTTWLANMLALSGKTEIASEPFNLDGWAYKLDGLAKNWFTYAPALPHDQALNAFNKVLQRKAAQVYGRRHIQRYIPFARQGRLIVKDPIACFSSEWIAQNFDIEVLVLIRHPAAFASSLKRMKWFFDFGHLLRQEQLIDEYLYPFIKEMEAEPTDVVAQAALIWKMIYYVLGLFLERNQSWIAVKHEVLSRDPVGELKLLYGQLGLDWGGTVERQIRQFTGKGNPVDPKTGVAHQMVRNSEKNITRWKSVLTHCEIDLVKEVTAEVACNFYSESDW